MGHPEPSRHGHLLRLQVERCGHTPPQEDKGKPMKREPPSTEIGQECHQGHATRCTQAAGTEQPPHRLTALCGARGTHQIGPHWTKEHMTWKHRRRGLPRSPLRVRS